MVLKGIDLSISTGEAVGLLGPNGAGKTTSFSIITGLIMADSGCIFLDENDITDMPMYKRARMGISYLPQDGAPIEELKQGEHTGKVKYWLISQGENKARVYTWKFYTD